MGTSAVHWPNCEEEDERREEYDDNDVGNSRHGGLEEAVCISDWGQSAEERQSGMDRSANWTRVISAADPEIDFAALRITRGNAEAQRAGNWKSDDSFQTSSRNSSPEENDNKEIMSNEPRVNSATSAPLARP